MGAYTILLVLVALHVPVWGDEGFTAMMVRRPWSAMLADLRHIDVNMTVHYVLVKGVTEVAGESPLALRLVSIIAVLVAGVLVHRLSRVIGLAHPCLVVGLLWLNPATITLAATARPYALLLAGGAASLLQLTRALRRPGWGNWLQWGAAAGVLVYVHLLAVLVVAAEVVFVGLQGRRDPRSLVRPAAGAAVAGVLGVPGALLAADRNTLAWVGRPTPRGMAAALADGLGGPLAAAVVLLLAASGLVALVRGRRRAPRHALPGDGGDAPTSASVVALPAVMAGSVGGFLLLLLPVQSLFVNEYLTIELLPVTLLAAQGLAALRRPVVAGTAALALLAMATGVQGRRDALTFDRTDWPTLVAELNGAVEPGDGIAFPNTFYRNVVEYYMLRQDAGGLEQATPVLPSDRWFSASAYQLDRDKRLQLLVTPAGPTHPLPRLGTIWLVAPDDDDLALAVTADLRRAGYRESSRLTATNVSAVEMRLSGGRPG